MKRKSESPSLDSDFIRLLFKRQAELNSLLELTRAINKNSGLKDLLEILKVILMEHLNIKEMRLYVKKGPFFYNLFGFGDECSNNCKVYRTAISSTQILRISDNQPAPDKEFRAYEFYVPVLYQRELRAFTLLKSLNAKKNLLNHDLNFIQTLVSLIIVAHENKKLQKDKLEKERLERELELGRQVQQMLIPSFIAENNVMEVDAWYQPHESIGGDYYDFYQINDDKWIWCIADVSGKGISGALLMANLQASLKAWFSITDNPREIVRRLNDFIWINTRGERYITLFLGVYCSRNKILKYVNAGHQPPILFLADGHKELKTGTTVLGAFHELPFINMGVEKLSPGNLIFNFTDGLLERKQIRDHISEQQIVDFLKDKMYIPLSELHQSLLKHLQSAKSKPLTDDLTLLSIRIKNT